MDDKSWCEWKLTHCSEEMSPLTCSTISSSVLRQTLSSHLAGAISGSSYYTGVSNVFRYDLGRKELEVLSNAETGLFRPLALPDGSLLAFEYGSDGFLPVKIPNTPIQDVNAISYLGQRIVDKYPVVKSWKLSSPSDVDVEFEEPTGYSPVRQMRLVSTYPIVQGYRDSAAVGLRLDFADPIGLTDLNLTASYSPGSQLPTEEKLHLGFHYRYWQWRAHGSYNGADFYDLFGPMKNSRKGYSLGFSHHKNLFYDSSRSLSLDWGLTGYGGLDRLPEYQNVEAPFEEFLTAHVTLSYFDLSRSIGAVEDERGLSLWMASQFNYVNSDVLPRFYGAFDYSLFQPMDHSPVWLRTSLGHSFGDRDNSFANFHFGGFGNNYVDRLQVSRYRSYYSFPGVELNEIGGTSYAKILVEWNLPPLRFRRLGGPNLYGNWARLSLFGSGLVTDAGGSRR